jgi:dienelactone hydrolase
VIDDNSAAAAAARDGRAMGASIARPSAVPGYEDWPAQASATPSFVAADASVQALANVLGLRRSPAPPRAQRGETTVRDGVAITPLRWRTPYGPATEAWELRPADSAGPRAHGGGQAEADENAHASAGGGARFGEDRDRRLPGILALHQHGGRRSTGAAQLVDVHGENPGAWANRLAKRGFVVLAHDTFSWASRRFDLSSPPPKLARDRDALMALWAAERHEPTPDEVFDAVSNLHENLIAKAAGALGQTFAGMVVADDLIALDVLSGLPGVDANRLGAVGFSGGGGRAHLLGALDDRISAVAIACMMATFGSLMPDYIETHSWLLHSPGLPQLCDWPELARVGSFRRMLVLYGERDPLFPRSGMHDADRMLESVEGYDGRFFDCGHEFGDDMMCAAEDFFGAWAAGPAPVPREPRPAASARRSAVKSENREQGEP